MPRANPRDRATRRQALSSTNPGRDAFLARHIAQRDASRERRLIKAKAKLKLTAMGLGAIFEAVRP